MSEEVDTSGFNNTITFRLEPEGTGTRLFFEQAGLDLDSPLGRNAYENMSRGWPGLLRRIDSALAA
ncbi:SRPBCC family protein [Catellatospora sichuanensis]|uniref:SRPBCC family protein n=1 Tax=Catellatospora sichuanensis TaxID=1969805 RepID=UPI0011823A64|nr:SRPBCC domain-containing protein [Catellatospora sichuanensis]